MKNNSKLARCKNEQQFTGLFSKYLDRYQSKLRSDFCLGDLPGLERQTGMGVTGNGKKYLHIYLPLLDVLRSSDNNFFKMPRSRYTNCRLN